MKIPSAACTWTLCAAYRDTIQFPTMFSTQSGNCIPFVHIFEIISLFAAELEESKIGMSSKG